MDWYSLFFILASGAAFIYTGLGLMWGITVLWSPDQLKVMWIKTQWKGLALAWATMVIIAATLYVMHVLDVITMWEIGYVLQRGL